MKKSMKKLKVGIGVAAAALVAGAFMATPAFAHTSVYDSNPQDGAPVDAAPEEVWVQFGSTMLPAPQPMAIGGGHLEVYDACGEQVSSGESEMNDQQSQLTVVSGGNAAGRYELIWTVEAADGEAQSGLLDFLVSAGKDCDHVLRRDALKDVDRGLDIKSLRATQTAAGVTKAQMKLKKAISCKSLGKRSDDALQLLFDTNADDAADYVGPISCKNDRFKVTVTENDEDTVLATYRATLSPNGTVLATRVKASDFSDGEHFDLAAESINDSDDCEAPAEGEEAPVCVDRAPDLGVLRAF